MNLKLALVGGALFAAVSAGTLTAQSTTTTKTYPSSSSKQHVPAAQPAGQQDSTSMRASAGAKTHVVWTKAQITEAQQGLAKAGFYKGTPSGKFDRSTKKAIRKYQKANSLPVTGRLDNDLLTRLHSS